MFTASGPASPKMPMVGWVTMPPSAKKSPLKIAPKPTLKNPEIAEDRIVFPRAAMVSLKLAP